ncbi:Peptidase family M23 [Fodinibius salinus]|uniref:Peptidase family M23 n=1 Tax=Fodinibius salinus TaxID=860790 RepID=A0A5D3YNS4_9BACT|nr:M23 family metallopeptidase [Fodinibius salinus]TYP95008.1 Peptidase family M23 [Fodinibius salinus]
MLDFLKEIFKNKDRDITFVLFDDEMPESSTSYQFKPSGLWKLFYSALIAVVLITLVLVMFTPLSTFLYNTEDAQLRQRVITVSQKVQSLQDSLRARDSQLSDMKKVISEGSDTSFAVSQQFEESSSNKTASNAEPNSVNQVSVSEMLSQNEVIFSEIFKQRPDFPTGYPIEGTFTRGYEPQNGHYGIDIATQQGTSFKAIADGAVINQNWTFNFGFVLHVQHNDGIITVYKHAASLSKSIGDIVTKGDILGTAGDVGVLSSGPHLHIEIWKNGIPQNPNAYLIKS